MGGQLPHGFDPRGLDKERLHERLEKAGAVMGGQLPHGVDPARGSTRSGFTSG